MTSKTRKSAENHEKPEIFSKKIPKKFFRRRKIESCKSSETRFPEVSCRSEPSSRGERTFEVRIFMVEYVRICLIRIWHRIWYQFGANYGAEFGAELAYLIQVFKRLIQD